MPSTTTKYEYAVQAVGRGYVGTIDNGRPGVQVKDQPQVLTRDLAWRILREAQQLYKRMGCADITLRVIVRTCTTTTEYSTWSPVNANTNEGVNHV